MRRLALAVTVLMGCLLAPGWVSAQGVSISTSTGPCPSPSRIGASGNPGLLCWVQSPPTLFVWNGSIWSQLFAVTTTGFVTITPQALATTSVSGAALPTQQAGDITLAVETGPIVPPGPGYVTLRVRQSGALCTVVTNGGSSLIETPIGSPFPCPGP